MFKFKSLPASEMPREVLALDIGYSANARSCGVAWSGEPQGIQLQFGSAIDFVASKLSSMARPLLVVEAVLSTLHDQRGNPAIRGEFERARGWYYGPGAVTLIAAQRFLGALQDSLSWRHEVFIAEAFLSNKTGPTAHRLDAITIRDQFWTATPADLLPGIQPLIVIEGVPPVRVFQPRFGGARVRGDH